MFSKALKQYHFADVILLISLLLIGSFHEYIACALSAAMSIYLLYRIAKYKKLRVRQDFLTSGVVAVCFGYGLTCLWGIDRGMALIGFLKFLPLLLYLLCLYQQEETDGVLTLLPYVGAVMTVISAIFMQFTWGEKLFSVAGRLAGFFQYPNTFAIFLLTCQLLLLKKSHKTVFDYILLAVLIGGFLYTGSRTAFVVAILANAAMLFTFTKKEIRKYIWIGVVGAAVLAVILMLGENSVLRRYLTISLTESTFVGRLLYWVDALPLLLKHPFGMGYMGYSYIQHSIQTGVYSVAYIHNDFLQLLLDIGFVPAGLFFTALIIWFCKKTVPVADKIIVGAICLHSFFDFNLQYTGMFLLLLLLLCQTDDYKSTFAKPRLPLKVCFGALVLVCIYMGVALTMAHLGPREVSDTLYPYNTQNKLNILQQETDIEKAYPLSEEIAKQNTYHYAPYSIRAKYYYSQGNFTDMIKNERAALERNPFDHTEYEAYCKMLLIGIDLYTKAGNTQSADICKKELLSVREQLAANKDRLSPLGRLINDQPVYTLSPELEEEISRVGE